MSLFHQIEVFFKKKIKYIKSFVWKSVVFSPIFIEYIVWFDKCFCAALFDLTMENNVDTTRAILTPFSFCIVLSILVSRFFFRFYFIIWFFPPYFIPSRLYTVQKKKNSADIFLLCVQPSSTFFFILLWVVFIHQQSRYFILLSVCQFSDVKG